MAATPTGPFRLEAKLVDQVLGRPPVSDLFFDLEIENGDSRPLWFLLPDLLNGAAPPAGEPGCNGIEILALDREKKAFAARFLGLSGFKALRISAGGRLLLRGLAISLWEEEPAGSIVLEVRVAAKVEVGGRTAEDWLGGRSQAPLEGEIEAGRLDVVDSWHSPGLRPVDVEIEEVARLRAEVQPRL